MKISFRPCCCARIIALFVAWTWYGQSFSLWAEEEPTPLTLSTVVQHVLAEHPLSQAAQARIQIALGLTRQAGTYPNPEFTFTNNDFTYERTAGLKQVLEWPFKRAYRIDAATADVRVAESEQETIRQNLIATAREAFLRVLLYQESARVADTFATTTAQLQQSTAQRFQEGDVPAFEVTKANVEALKATKDLEVARGQLTTAQAGLNLLLGQSEMTPLSLAGSLVITRRVAPREELYASAEEHNPLLITQRKVVEREQLNLKVARAARIPDVAIDLTRGEDLKAGIVGPVVGVSFALPLWNRNEGAISAAESKVTEAEATLRATRLQIHQTLLTAYRTWETARKQVDAFTTGLLVQAEEAATLAERSYREGEGDLLGVLDAQRSLLSARRDYTQALFEQDIAWVAIERAAGIGTEP